MARVVLYDADCAFCTRSAAWLLRLGCAVETIPWQSWAPLSSYDITPEAAAAALHFVDEDRVRIGHQAIAGALRHSRHAWVRLAGRLLAARLLGPLARRAYAAVAANRQRLPGGTARCALPHDHGSADSGASRPKERTST